MLLKLTFGATVLLLASLTIHRDDHHEDDTPPQYTAGDSIEAKITGRLQTVWKPGELLYAAVEAGGSHIELNPAGCEQITAELLDFINNQGGGIITATQVEVEGSLTFAARPESLPYRRIRNEDAQAIVPVLRVAWLRITTLPVGDDTIRPLRAREAVVSTTVSLPR